MFILVLRVVWVLDVVAWGVVVGGLVAYFGGVVFMFMYWFWVLVVCWVCCFVAFVFGIV